ncbi:MAG: MBL fold metallo-hydrolase [Melioribacteraceae bacterium]|nr:MBL fold metallo-hydrolase [Melioribacteraceae bacterium]MCF8357049.1 MBL fold metallo-hydrolase [Melioribacteraceae bacterium]MCF8396504.1 MBL fold metallo-hydrolase [Melioribacteraceae bacterium]
MKIGKYDVTTIESGSLGLDGGAMFGIIPKPLWQKTNSPDDRNRIKIVATCMLLQSDSKIILVDTGIGQNWDEKFVDIYKVDHTQNDLMKSLKEKSVKQEDVTDVILTHLHFDHVGGAVVKENDKFIPAFPNAAYHVQEKHYNWAVNPSEKDRGSFERNRFVPLFEEGVLKLWNETSFDDEIEFVVVNGHTFSQQLIKVSDSSKTVLFCADLIPFESHFKLPFIMGYDLQPLKTLEEKKTILPKAVDEDWMLLLQHDPENVAVKIEHDPKGFKVKERIAQL